GLTDRHRARARRLAGTPEAKDERRPAAADDRQGGRIALACERRQKRERVRLVAERMKGRNDPRAPEAREAQTLLGEPLGESGANVQPERRAPGESVEAERCLWIGVGRGQGRRGRSERGVKDKARSRDGRWTVIPGAYVSRWAPCAEAHEPRQGQLP